MLLQYYVIIVLKEVKNKLPFKHYICRS